MNTDTGDIGKLLGEVGITPQGRYSERFEKIEELIAQYENPDYQFTSLEDSSLFRSFLKPDKEKIAQVIEQVKARAPAASVKRDEPVGTSATLGRQRAGVVSSSIKSALQPLMTAEVSQTSEELSKLRLAAFGKISKDEDTNTIDFRKDLIKKFLSENKEILTSPIVRDQIEYLATAPQIRERCDAHKECQKAFTNISGAIYQCSKDEEWKNGKIAEVKELGETLKRFRSTEMMFSDEISEIKTKILGKPAELEKLTELEKEVPRDTSPL